MLRILPVPPGEVQAIWGHVAPHFASFAERSQGEVSTADFLHDVMTGEKQCWVAIRDRQVAATALTRAIDSPMHTVEIMCCAGEGRHDWRDQLVDEIEAWAKSRGSKRLRIICRPGWTKELKRLGFRESHRVLEREIDEQKPKD